jgi:hypothetical protein
MHGPLIVDNSKSAKADEFVVPGQGRPTVETSGVKSERVKKTIFLKLYALKKNRFEQGRQKPAFFHSQSILTCNLVSEFFVESY